MPSFDFVGGDPSLDFVNTVDWLVDGLANERLTSYERLTRWAEGAGVISRQAAETLRRLATARPGEAESALRSARELRTVLARLIRQAASGELSNDTCGAFASHLSGALSRLGLAPHPSAGRRATLAAWRWHDADRELVSPLWPVAWSAAQLVTSREGRRLRVCAGGDCGWVFVDRSRNHLRRWCQMRTCGTAAKSERRRRRGRARAGGRAIAPFA